MDYLIIYLQFSLFASGSKDKKKVQQNDPRSFYAFPASDFKSVISPRDLGLFEQKLILKTIIWASLISSSKAFFFSVTLFLITNTYFWFLGFHVSAYMALLLLH